MESLQDTPLNRRAVSVVHLQDAHDAVDDGLTKTPKERLCAL